MGICMDYKALKDMDIKECLMEIFMEKSSSDFNDILYESRDGRLVKYLSHMRTNFLQDLICHREADVMVIGDEGAALAEYLSDYANNLFYVEPDNKWQQVDKLRCKDLENITFVDGINKCGHSFDLMVVCDGMTKINAEMLCLLKNLLKKDGRIIWVVKNKYALSSFATNSNEIGLGHDLNSVIKLINEAGFSRDEVSKYYPWPDSTYTIAMYSDDYLPKKGELVNIYRNFDAPVMKMFDESKIWDEIISDGKFANFSHEWIFVLGKKEDSFAFVKYSNDRAKNHRIKTSIFCNENCKDNRILKSAMDEASVTHIERLCDSYERLTDKYRDFEAQSGIKIKFNKILSCDDGAAELEFVEAESLEQSILNKLAQGNVDAAVNLVKDFADFVRFNRENNIWNVDLIFKNIFVRENVWTVIDYEWVSEDNNDLSDFIIQRAVYYFLVDNPNADTKGIDWYGAVCVEKPYLLHLCYEQDMPKEKEFQESVKGEHHTLSELYGICGRSVWNAKDAYTEEKIRKDLQHLDVEQLEFRDDRIGEEHTVTVELNGNNSFVLHPTHCCCFVYLVEIPQGCTLKTNGIKLGRHLYGFNKCIPTMNFSNLCEKNVKVKLLISPQGNNDSPVFEAVLSLLQVAMHPIKTGVKKIFRV